jgi:hypothetical protein
MKELAAGSGVPAKEHAGQLVPANLAGGGEAGQPPAEPGAGALDRVRVVGEGTIVE